MKIYHQEIISCYACPNYNRPFDNTISLNFCRGAGKLIEDEYLSFRDAKIPEWCPLPDKEVIK